MWGWVIVILTTITKERFLNYEFETLTHCSDYSTMVPSYFLRVTSDKLQLLGTKVTKLQLHI